MANEEESLLEENQLELQLQEQRDPLAAVNEALASDPTNHELLSMDSEGDGYFTNLLTKESTFEKQFNEQFSMDYSNGVRGSQQVPIEESPSTGKKKGGNFSVEEDELLVSAWLNTSIDSVIGIGQKNATLWKRILLYYNKYKTFESTRNHNSLMNRWSAIQCATNKFCGSIAQVALSGHVEQDRIAQAKRLYLEVHKSNFQFMHCWVILREEPKWLDEGNKRKKKKQNNNAASSPSTPSSINLGEDDIIVDNVANPERPPGRKAEKDRLSKGKRKSTEDNDMSSPMQIVINKIMEDNRELNKKKFEIYEKTYIQEQERIDVERKKIQLKKKKREDRIIAMKLSEMNEIEAAYYHSLQMEILAKRSGNI